MKLDEIGFYTLTDERAKNTSVKSPLWRCELLLTSRCNFHCPYCRGTDRSADITFEQARNIVDMWCSDGLKNIRFTGGEPTLVEWLPKLVRHVRNKQSIERVAISTNGSASRNLYNELLDSGVDDFSLSFDSCYSSIGTVMLGGKRGMWETVVSNIKYLASKTYVTVGVVIAEDNYGQMNETIECASNELGVADIRIISSAQFNKLLTNVQISQKILDKHPILRYRWDNILRNRNVRGICEGDNKKCPLMLDDMAVKGEYHYPCIIKMREGCAPVGKMAKSYRSDRLAFYEQMDASRDLICRTNCLDVCIDYNNKVLELNTTGGCNASQTQTDMRCLRQGCRRTLAEQDGCRL